MVIHLPGHRPPPPRCPELSTCAQRLAPPHPPLSCTLHALVYKTAAALHRLQACRQAQAPAAWRRLLPTQAARLHQPQEAAEDSAVRNPARALSAGRAWTTLHAADLQGVNRQGSGSAGTSGMSGGSSEAAGAACKARRRPSHARNPPGCVPAVWARPSLGAGNCRRAARDGGRRRRGAGAGGGLETSSAYRDCRRSAAFVRVVRAAMGVQGLNARPQTSPTRASRSTAATEACGAAAAGLLGDSTA